MKVQIMIKFMLIAISILLYGCKNNEIRFDFKTNSIKTINNNGLYSLIISSKESLEDYYYIYLEKGQKADEIYTFFVGKPVYGDMRKDYGDIGQVADFLN